MPEHVIHVIQGEFVVSDDPDAILTTVLGSCVAACLYDESRRIGGMNHFLLPDADDGVGTADIRFASAAMEQLVNALLKQGAARARLRAKLFGGARMMAGLPDIGRRNGAAAIVFLQGEGIPCLSQSLGGTQARRVRFHPASGRAQQLLLGQQAPDPITPVTARVGAVELF